MSLLRLQGVSRYYGADHVLGPLDLEVNPGERIGLVGPNGSGKTTLLNILAGEEPDEGHVTRPKKMRCGYLCQQTPVGDRTALYDFTALAFHRLVEEENRLRELEAKMADDQVQADPDALKAVMESYARTTAVFEQDGGYEQEARTRAALFGLGFTEPELSQPVNTLSGGQQARAQLARVLLGNPDLLLLDEPTNHLDLSALEWLQGYLQRFTKSLILVSHDRYLLDAVATHIWEVEQRDVVTYPGNFAASRKQARARRERMAKVYAADRDERERLEAYIRKYKAGTRSNQAKSRSKRLERMAEAPPPPEEAARAIFTAPRGSRSQKRVCTLEGLTLGYDGHTLLSQLNLEITRGQRIGVAGPNGSGKSTLLRAIVQETKPLAGRVELGRGVAPAHFSQTRVDLDPSRTVLDEASAERGQRLGEARSFLARFLFRGEEVHKLVSVLSGGEKSRLALAKLLLHGGNFLLLDEPTNHLDIGMREALQEALVGYDGTLLFITHDRSLLDALADVVWWIEDGELHVIDGGYSRLVEWLEARRTLREHGAEGEGRSGKRPRDGVAGGRSAAPRDRSRGKPAGVTEVRASLAALETEIESLTREKGELEQLLADPDTYDDPGKVEELSKRHATVSSALTDQEEVWTQLVEAVDEGAL